MTLEWNPEAEDVVGVEHIDAGQNHTSLVNAQGAAFGLRFEADISAALNSIDIYAGSGVATSALDDRFGTLDRPIMVDLVETDDEASDTVQVTGYAPTSIVASSGMVSENWGAANLNRITSPDDGLFLAASKLNAFVDVTFDTAAFPLDRQILRIGFRVDTNATWRLVKLDPPSNSVYSWYKDIPGLAPSPMPFWVSLGDAKYDNGDTEWTWWTPAEVREMASGGGRKWRFQCRAGPGAWRLDYVRMYVVWAPERRVGVGIGEVSGSTQWINIDMRTPAGTGDPSLVAGQEYTAVLRQATPYSQDAHATRVTFPWRALEGATMERAGEVWSLHKMAMTTPAISSSLPNIVFGPLQMGGVQLDVSGIACCRMVTGSGLRPETQPYELMRGALCYDSHTVDQTIVIADGAKVYGQVLAMIGRKTVSAVGPIRCEVLNSGGARVLGVTSMSAFQWVDAAGDARTTRFVDDMGYSYKRVRFQFDDFSALTPGTYTIRLSAPDADEDSWRVGCLISSATSVDQTFGGTTEAAEGLWLGGDGSNRELTDAIWHSDALAVLATVPPPVDNVRIAVGVVTAHHTNAAPGHSCFDQGCVDQGSPFARVSWDIASDVATEYYQVQRTDPRDVARGINWDNVARVWGLETLSWDDHEVRMAMESSYRVRPVRGDGVAGEWSEVATVTVPANVALAFTSNAATGMGCTYFESWESRTSERGFDHQEFDDVEYRAIYGRNGQLGFRPIERRGVRFSRTLLLSSQRTIQAPSLDVSQALRDLAWAPIPYVCIRDGEGNRWFANVEVPSTLVSKTEGTEIWRADLTVIEATTRPHNLDTSEPQVEVADVGIA
jgi:hypothetical protein